jgi:hypothetical protein
VPEISYRRIGDTIGEDGPTFYSDNVLGGYRFQSSNAPLTVEVDGDGGQGFRGGDTPGLPSFGQTGRPTRVTYRGDARQELDWPFSLGQFRFVPYVVGGTRGTRSRRTRASRATTGCSPGAGLRVTTAFWKVDDTAKSELFDIHRLRHVVEPEVNVFTSAQSLDRSTCWSTTSRSTRSTTSRRCSSRCGSGGRPSAAGGAAGGAWTSSR